MVAIPEVQRLMGQMRSQVTENASHMEMLADSVDRIHYGLVDSGNWRIRPPSRIDPSSKTSHVHCGAGQPCGNECHWTFPIHDSKSGIRAMKFCMGLATTQIHQQQQQQQHLSNDADGASNGVVHGEGGESESERQMTTC